MTSKSYPNRVITYTGEDLSQFMGTTTIQKTYPIITKMGIVFNYGLLIASSFSTVVLPLIFVDNWFEKAVNYSKFRENILFKVLVGAITLPAALISIIWYMIFVILSTLLFPIHSKNSYHHATLSGSFQKPSLYHKFFLSRLKKYGWQEIDYEAAVKILTANSEIVRCTYFSTQFQSPNEYCIWPLHSVEETANLVVLCERYEKLGSGSNGYKEFEIIYGFETAQACSKILKIIKSNKDPEFVKKKGTIVI